MLNVSQAAEISYNVGIMPRNIGTLDGGEGIRKKRNWGKGQRQEGKLKDNDGQQNKTKQNKTKHGWLHHIAWVWPSSR